jgi:hypothetical protein
MNSVSSVTSCSKCFVSNHDVWRPILLLMLVVLAGSAGCGDSSNEVSVQGRVTYRGEPLPRGSVTFFPTTGRPVNAPLGDDGTYSTQLPPGEYTVTVSYTEPLPEGFKEGDPTPRPKFLLPPEYTTRARSTLTATVSEDSEEGVNFELK